MFDGKLLVAVAVGIVALVLLVGLYSLFRGGDFARSYSNKIMRLRIVAQLAAIVIIMAVLYFSSRGAGTP
ncbi:MAG: twin transmembrane helix small protein [Alphaproteobacteria bacterium]|nr:twin transmembrane helix small protein [Alphaproteobacteria bacterium]